MENKKLGYFLGSILIILGIISFSVLFFDHRMFGSCPPCFYMASPLYYSGIICLILGIIIVIYVYIRNVYIRKEKAKSSDIDEQMKRLSHLSIGLLICGWPLCIIIFFGFVIGYAYSPLGPVISAFFIIMGLLMGFIGLFGIIVYRLRPEKLRNYLLKRNESKEEQKVQT